MPDVLQRRKELAMAFYDTMFNRCRPREAVADDRIVEHWDVLQVMPETSANDNGMF